MLKFLLLLLSVIMIVASCSNDDSSSLNPEDNLITPGDSIPIPEVDPIFPIDFRYITLNHKGESTGEQPSLSYVKKDNYVLPTYYSDVNGDVCVENPQSLIQIEDELFVVMGSYWFPNKIEILDPNTFKIKKTITFGQNNLTDIEHIKDSLVIIVGDDWNAAADEKYNVIIGNIKADEDQFIISTFNLGFSLRKVAKIGDKIFVGGSEKSKIMVFDIDNISLEGAREIEGSTRLFGNTSDFLLDKNGMVWVDLRADNGAAKLCCINPETEKIIKEIAVPNTTSSKTFATAICPKGEFIYTRSHEAFYRFNVDNPKTPDDPLFEHNEHTGIVNDLQFTKEGYIIFIDEDLAKNAPSTIYEYKENQDGTWTKVKEDGIEIGAHAKYIYIGKYEKQF